MKFIYTSIIIFIMIISHSDMKINSDILEKNTFEEVKIIYN